MTDFEATRKLFHLPNGIVYLDGNSLGPLPKMAAERVARAMTAEWGDMLITAWNRAGWIDMPAKLGDRIGRLIGAPQGSVVLGDTLSIKVYQALASALAMRPERKIVLSDTGNFPSDLYIAQGLIRGMGQGHQLKTVAPEKVAAAIDQDVAAVMLTEVDYRTGRLHDMGALTKKAHAAGAVMIWDLAHSAGALPVDLAASNAEFATGCTYKYLNGGPGAPAFIYIRPDLQAQVQPALAGWLGHDAPFAFEPQYRPAGGISRMRVGTPPVIQMAALEASMDIWDTVDMEAVRRRSILLSETFITQVEAKCPDLELASPRDAGMRGSQVSLRFKHGFAAMRALIARGVIGDFRAPDIMRFGFCPLYNSVAEVEQAASILGEILATSAWDRPEHHARTAVT